MKNLSEIKCIFMQNKRFFLIMGILLVFVSVVGVYSADNNTDYGELSYLLDETNESDLWGCCSIVWQLDGNNSIMAFRRDAAYSADIHIEKINWHGKEAIKQYKTDGKYFCQVIVTNDGWTIGYGGLDDGDDNVKIENMTGKMVENNNIDNATLQEIQGIKQSYGRGHVLIKAPDGRFGVAMGYSHWTGKLNPGEYISIPNKESFVRTGDMAVNSTDKAKIMTQLETSDGYGLSRRDVTTFLFHQVENDTFKGNITDITLSNDDGSAYGMSTGGLADNVIFNGTTVKAEDIPIAPKYTTLGSLNFTDQKTNEDNGGILATVGNVLFYFFIFIICVILFVIIIRLINRIRYARRRQRRQQMYTKDLYGRQPHHRPQNRNRDFDGRRKR